MNDDVYRLLALCAHPPCDATDYPKIAQAAVKLKDWDEVPIQAEAHAMAPLLYVHLKRAGVGLPLAVKRALQGLYVRHRWANQVRMRVLREVLAAYQAIEIPALVLKGAALSHLVYPEPGLRPMSDLDILVPRSEVWRAQQELAELGFNAPLRRGGTLPHRHLPTATLCTEGLWVEVEIHHQLFSDYFDHALAYVRSRLAPVFRLNTGAEDFEPGLVSPGQAGKWETGHDPRWMGLDVHPFSLDGQTAYTLGYEALLGHVCRHLISHVNVWDYGRLIWVADMVGLAERFAAEIDWERIRRQAPEVLATLSLVHFTTPLSDELLSQAPIEIGHVPHGIGVEYQGWPRTGRTHWRERGYRRVLGDTLFPSEWWLRLRYGLGSTHPLFWQRWVRHPLYILGHVVRAGLERLGWPTPGELAQGRRAR
jgi:hypothetical protein